MSNTVPVVKYASSRSGSSEASDILDMRDDEGWEDAELDEEEQNFISLLDDEVFHDINSMLEHCKVRYNFDFLEIRQRATSDFYDNIKLVNFIRSQVHSTISREDFEDEKFLKPVLDDDALLISLDELPEILPREGNKPELTTELVSRVSELEEELRRTQSQFEDYRTTVKHTLDERWAEATVGSSGSNAVAKDEPRDDDNHYFNSYSYNDIHETMLKDTVRTDAYRDFIYNHKALFAGKVVLDVGCGTGILSMFCAKAGAARVIAVDNSSIIDKARENIFNNGFSDKITCLRGKVEEVTLPVDAVDIIVSEWMGYCLLYEAMLDSVIWARDKYLRPDGLMVPSHMNLWVGPVADPDYVADHFGFWRDVYGFDMKAMQVGIHDDAQVLNLPATNLCGEPFPFLQLSLHSTTVKDLVFKRKWQTKLTKDIDALDGFIIWFDSFFMPSREDTVPEDAKAEEWAKAEKKGVAFTTGPMAKETHWKQGIMFIDTTKVELIEKKEGAELTGELDYAVPATNSRALDVSITWKFDADEKETSQSWKMR